MADSGFNWDAAWTPVPEEDTTDWTSIALTDTSGARSDPISNDVKAATEVSLLCAGGTGTVDGVMTISVLRDVDGTNYEDTTYSSPWSFSFTPTVSQTAYKTFTVSAADVSNFRIYVQNESGITCTNTLKFRQATIPVAS